MESTDVVIYTAAGNATCQVGTGDGGRVEVTLQAADFDNFVGAMNSTEQFLCVVLPPPGGGDE